MSRSAFVKNVSIFHFIIFFSHTGVNVQFDKSSKTIPASADFRTYLHRFFSFYGDVLRTAENFIISPYHGKVICRINNQKNDPKLPDNEINRYVTNICAPLSRLKRPFFSLLICHADRFGRCVVHVGPIRICMSRTCSSVAPISVDQYRPERFKTSKSVVLCRLPS